MVLSLFHWSKITLKPAKIWLFWAMGLFTWHLHPSQLTLQQTRVFYHLGLAQLWSKHKTQVNTLNISEYAFSTSGGLRREFVMQSVQGHFITGHCVAGGASLMPIKAAQWCFEAKKAWCSGWKNITGSVTKLANFQFSARLTWTRITWLNLLPQLSNVIKPNGSNYDSETRLFTAGCGAQKNWSHFLLWVYCCSLFWYNFFRRIHDVHASDKNLEIGCFRCRKWECGQYAGVPAFKNPV